MICAACGTENRAGRKFCSECAAPLSIACPSCGTANEPSEKFCGECATPLGLAPAASPVGVPLAAGPRPVAERRVVTVLFADIVGFTPYAEERDAEDVRETLSRYFELCSGIVSRYGGTVEKFIGDAVMAVWGAPTAHEDDAERAVRAALDLVDSVGSLGPGIQARAGVLTGEAAVTIGATNQGIVAGDMVNTAARLQSVAPPGSVLVGELTMLGSSGAIAYEQAGEQQLKGKQSPVPAWRAVRIVAERGGRNRSQTLEAPFVGRGEELRLLKELLDATGREQRVRLVSVMGPGGIGKSRLAWEFAKYVDGLVENIYWHSGRSPAYGEGITFWALGEMVRSRCGLVEGADEDVTRRKVRESVDQWLSEAEEKAWVERGLLALLGVETGLAPDQLFGAWRTYFERIASAGTVVLVFEDAHHADSGLLDFIEHLLEWSRHSPIYIVTLARPELLERRADWGAGKRNFASLFLEPLSDADMAELLAGLVPGLPDDAVRAIIARADGIPLYAVETVRSLVSDGRLHEEDGRYAPTDNLGELAVPPTLTALIASRLDALEAGDRALVQDAAVLGQSFGLDALAVVTGEDPAAIQPRVERLVRRELLMRDVDERSAERGQYAFVQSLIREVAYNTLARKDRKTRHLAAARYFEQLDSEELASAKAGHYLAARENAADGAEADALAAQARVALRSAADRAATLGAQDQAVAFLQQALTVTTEPADRADLLERAADSAAKASHYDLGADLARQAIEIRVSAGDRLAAARATAGLGYVYLTARRDAEGREVLEQALAEYGDLWPDPALAELKTLMARAHEQFNESQASVKLADEALEVAEHGNHPELLSRALITKGASLGSLGRLRESIALIRAGEEVAREHDLTELVITGLVVRGYHLGEIDNYAAAQCIRDGLALARRAGQRGMVHMFVNNLGYTGFLTGDWDEALDELDAVLAEDLDENTRVWLLSNELIIRASRGESISDGIAALDRLVADHDDLHVRTAPMDTKANEAQAQGRLEEAQRQWLALADNFISQGPASYYQAARPALWDGDLEAVRRYLELLDSTGFHGPVVEARRATIRAGIMALEGRAGESLAAYKEAITGWRELGIAWEEALTGIDVATVLDAALPEVQAIGTATRETLERLGARPYIERLDAALARQSAGQPAPAEEPTRPLAADAV